MNEQSQASELRRLLDERAIRDVLAGYCRGIDRMDADLVRSCYHPDATDHHGSFAGDVDEFMIWVWRVLGRYDATTHLLGQILVEQQPEDADVARVETYGVATHRTAGGDQKLNLTVGFRFIDRFERRSVDGRVPQWRIAARFATTEWVQAIPAEQWWPIPPTMATGARDGTDPVQEPWSRSATGGASRADQTGDPAGPAA